jgi:NitT/TauT family transport system ATP-binding protein
LETESLLELRNIGMSFTLESGHRLRVLEDINLQMRGGQTLALLGPSGSGKSTCLRILCGLQSPTEGTVLSRGQPLEGINTEISLVFQSFALLPWETVKRNIEISLLSLRLSEAEAQARVKKAIDIVGLEGFEEAFPRELSGGMKQRVGVARALAMERPILFLDEPFSALDVLTADSLRDEIMNIFLSGKTKTKAMLVVTHNIQEAVVMADRIFVMGSHPGKIRAEFLNPLPYPRDPESSKFLDLVSQIHHKITETYMSDSKDVGVKGSVLQTNKIGEILETLPDIHILDMIGLIETIASEGGSLNIFRLAADIGSDFGKTLYLTQAAEMLELVETPKQQVSLTQQGREFARGDVNIRKKMLHENFGKLKLVKAVCEILKEAPNFRFPIEDLHHQIHEWLPNENAKKLAQTLISWGRYSEYFGYNDLSQSFYLDLGEDV